MQNAKRKTPYFKIRVIASLLLGGAFFSVFLWKEEPKITDPLLDMEIEKKIPRNAVLMENLPVISGQFPENISGGNYILRGKILIPSGKTVDISEPSFFYAERDSGVVVEGELNVSNAAFLSNQLHPDRKYWHGLTAANNGTINLTSTTISDATSAITAESGGKIKIEKSKFSENIAGLSSLKGGTLEINNSEISDGTVGIQAIEGKVTAVNCLFQKLQNGARVFPEAIFNETNSTYRTTGEKLIKK